MQDYKMVFRTLTGGDSVINPQTGELLAQNVSQFMSYLNEQYLAQGYTILNTTLLRVMADGKTPYMTEWAFHLVKEVVTKAK